METTAFLRGMGAGAVAGAAIGAMVAVNRKAMRTGVGRAMQQAGAAMDTALYDFMHTMR
ncbi:MAG: hypothetical protein IJV43_05675 [Oscillospiraceae bacterium]|nr:hypothetical protein [Oscillospiraceae bacterium]